MLAAFIRILIISIYSFSFSTINAGEIGLETGYKIPRFVSLKSNDVNLRVGSSTNYPILLKYITSNLPLKIIDEYDAWRKIIDIENNEGWVHKSLLKGDRYGIINQPYETNIQLFNKPQGIEKGRIGKNNIVKIKRCLIDWCLIQHGTNQGWIKKNNLWGVFTNEKINIPFYQPIFNFIWKFDFLNF